MTRTQSLSGDTPSGTSRTQQYRVRFPAMLDHDAGGLRDALNEAIPVAGTMQDVTARVIPGHLGDTAAVINGQDQIARCGRRTRQDRFGEYVCGHLHFLPPAESG